MEIPEKTGSQARETNSHASIRDFRSGRAAAVSTATSGLQFGCHDMSGPEVAGGALPHAADTWSATRGDRWLQRSEES